MKESTLTAKVSEFAADHPNAVVCAMFHKRWRADEKLTHIYYVVKDGQPARVPAHKTLNAELPRYTLDVEHGQAWRDFTGHDLYLNHLARRHINEAYLSDHEYLKLLDACQARALRINRWLKNRRIASLRQEGRLA